MSALGSVDIIILAGGLGTRLRPRVSDRPKVVAEVAGKPFLNYHLDAFKESGARRVILATGYRADQIVAQYGERYSGMLIEYSCEPTPLGTGGAIRQALPLLGTDTALVVNGDSYGKIDFEKFVAFHKARRAKASIALFYQEDSGRFGRVETETASGMITAFREKDVSAKEGLVNGGIYLISRALLDKLPQGKQISLERELFPEWVKENSLYGYEVEGGSFLDIGTPESFDKAQGIFRQD